MNKDREDKQLAAWEQQMGEQHDKTLQSVSPPTGEANEKHQRAPAAATHSPRATVGASSATEHETLVRAASDLSKAARYLREASKLQARGVISAARQRRLILKAISLTGDVNARFTTGRG